MLISLYDKMRQSLLDYPKTIAGAIDRGNWLLSNYPA